MTRGGSRTGAGRPPGSGKFGEPTKAIRIPESQVESVFQFLQKGSYARPLYESLVPAGFPSPAENEIERTLDLNELLIKHPAATFFVRVSGFSMINAGIHDNDILVVDRSVEAVHGKIIIAVIDGELTVKRFWRDGKKVSLRAENADYPSIAIGEESDFRVWGVVTSVIHQV